MWWGWQGFTRRQAARTPGTPTATGNLRQRPRLVISFLLFLTCWQLLQSAWSRLWQVSAPDINAWMILAMVVSIVIQAGTSYYELRAGRRLKSELLVADALHTRASILVSFSVLVGLGFRSPGLSQG